MFNYFITVWLKNCLTIKCAAISYKYTYKDNRIDSMYIEKENRDSMVVFFDEVVAWEVKHIKGEDSLIN